MERVEYKIEECDIKGIFLVHIGYSGFKFRMMKGGGIHWFAGESYVYKLCDIPSVHGVPKNPFSIYSPYCILYDELIELALSIDLESEPQIIYGQD